MKITEYIKNNTIYLDGGMGTVLQAKGLPAGELPERWNLSFPDRIKAIHRAYFDAGCNVVNTNTFGANSLKFSYSELEEIISSAIRIARRAAEESEGIQKKWVALDIGPTGRMLRPLGDLDFEDAVEIFAATVRLGVKYGADLVFIETFNDSLETKAALLAAKESCDLPVFVSNAYGEDGKLMTGADPVSMVAMLEGMGADAIGVNCSMGPDALLPVVKEYLKYSSLPVIMKPNAGLPKSQQGRTVYDLSYNEFARSVAEAVSLGVKAVGGCCGTTPMHLFAMINAVEQIDPIGIEKKNHTLCSSYTHAVEFSDSPVLIGERINPTGKPRFKEALRQRDIQYILNEAIAEEQSGAHILDVNLGLPEIDEGKLLPSVIYELQAVTDLPLQIDTSDATAMEAALRCYNGKAVINSVNGKRESMDAIFPLVKKYGGITVCLTLDEGGIPVRAEDRVEIAKKIIAEAEKYGIDKKDLIFDPLAMAVSADKNAPAQTLRAVKMITEELGCHTVLGISNVSFGLPSRDVINAAFFTEALSNGLSAAIMNPFSVEMMKAYHAFRALRGLDEGCAGYISFAESISESEKAVSQVAADPDGTGLQRAIFKGLKQQAESITKELLKEKDPLQIVNTEIIPTLNRVGEEFEAKRIYLPGLLMSAEAAKAAFEIIKCAIPKEKNDGKGRVVIATVKGDIHDIGKNIVKLILENYGYAVTDLGKSVSPKEIVSAAIRENADIVGLSALMTTTVPAMEETVRLLHREHPECKIMVGGAVLTEEYAKRIGADAYAKDAMEVVKQAEKLLKCKQI